MIELVAYYQGNSLAPYSPKLDITLKIPVSKFENQVCEQYAHTLRAFNSQWSNTFKGMSPYTMYMFLNECIYVYKLGLKSVESMRC